MTTINLKLGYFIETKKLSYNLKKKYIGKDKSGNRTGMRRAIAYDYDITGALRSDIRIPD